MPSTSSRLWKQLGACLVLWTLPGCDCARSSRFMKFAQERDTLPVVDPSLRKLSQAEMGEALRQIDTSLAPAIGTAEPIVAGPYFFCPTERRVNEQVRVHEGTVEASVDVDDSPCGRGDQAVFRFRMQCPGEPDVAISDTTVEQFAHHSGFNFTGAWEKRCLMRGEGKASFTQSTRVTTKERQQTYSIARVGGEPCNVSRMGDGPVTIHDCSFKARRESGGDVVELQATAENLVGHPNDRYYRSGTLHIVLNDWSGKVVFSDGSAPPVAQLSNGTETMNLTLGPK